MYLGNSCALACASLLSPYRYSYSVIQSRIHGRRNSDCIEAKRSRKHCLNRVAPSRFSSFCTFAVSIVSPPLLTLVVESLEIVTGSDNSASDTSVTSMSWIVNSPVSDWSSAWPKKSSHKVNNAGAVIATKQVCFERHFKKPNPNYTCNGQTMVLLLPIAIRQYECKRPVLQLYMHCAHIPSTGRASHRHSTVSKLKTHPGPRAVTVTAAIPSAALTLVTVAVQPCPATVRGTSTSPRYWESRFTAHSLTFFSSYERLSLFHSDPTTDALPCDCDVPWGDCPSLPPAASKALRSGRGLACPLLLFVPVS